MPARFLVLVVACIAAAPAFAQRGAMTVPRNLDQLTDRASDIVRGTVVSARVEKHPELTNLDTVVVTLRVRDTLKGHAAGTYTFRQYIWDVRDRYDAAGYRKGQDLLLLMIAPSDYGLSSPAGMNQGRFQHRTQTAPGAKLRSTARTTPALRRPRGRGAKAGARAHAEASEPRGQAPQGPCRARRAEALIRELAKGSE